MSSTLTEAQKTVEWWTADPTRTTVEFEVEHFWGLHTVRGRFRRFDGSYVVGPAGSEIELTIDAASVDTGISARDRHLRSADFFDVEEHPQVRFTSTRVDGLGNGRVHVSGELEAAGTRVPLAFDASVRVIDGELELEATTTVDQRAHRHEPGPASQRAADCEAAREDAPRPRTARVALRCGAADATVNPLRKPARRGHARVTGGDPHAERGGEDLEVERGAEVDRFAVDTGVYRRRPIHLDGRRRPRSPRRRAGPGSVDDDDPEAAAVEPGPRALRQRPIEGVRVVRHEDDRGLTMLVSLVVHDTKLGCRRARPEDLTCRLEQGSRLRVAIRRLPNRFAVHPERDVVEKQPTVHAGDVDQALEAVGERLERADEVVPIDAQVEREVISRAGGNADERQAVCTRSRRDDRERSVASGDAECIRAALHRLANE